MPTEFKNVRRDSDLVKKLNNLSWELKFNFPDSSIRISKLALEVSNQLNWKPGQAESYLYLGLFSYLKGDHNNSLLNYKRALIICEQEEKSKKSRRLFPVKSKTLGYTGLVYAEQGNLLRALDNYFMALKIDENLGNKEGIARHYGNIGIVYYDLKDYDKALEYYLKALKIAEQTGYEQLQANTLGNIGLLYSEQKNDFPNALDYFNRALKMADELGYKKLQANTLSNIGEVYELKGDLNTALSRYFIALKMRESLGLKHETANSLNSIGRVNYKLNQFGEAKKYLEMSKVMCDSIGSLSLKKENYAGLASLFYALKDWKRAYDYQKLLYAIKDSLESEQIRKESARKELQFDYLKKLGEQKIKNEAEKKIIAEKVTARDAQLKRAATQRIALICGAALLILFGGFMYNRLRVTNRQKKIIEHQKSEVEKQRDIAQKEREAAEQQRRLVEEKQKEIMSSISYAKRIQTSLITSFRYIEKNLERLKEKP